MPSDPDEELERVLDVIRETDRIDDDDRDALLEYNRVLRRKPSLVGTKRRLKNLKHLRLMAGYSDRYDPEELPDVRIVDTLEDREAAGQLTDWIHRTYSNETTNRDYRSAIRSFGEHVTEGDDLPDPIAEIPGGTSRNYKPLPDPSKIFKWEEHVIPMIEEASTARDKALIATSWDSGARSGEITEARIGGVADHEHGLKLTVEGKTGQRSILLINSVPYLRRWLDVHPAGDDPQAPIWSALRSAKEISYRAKLNILQDTAEAVDKPLPARPTFTLFRKSNASFLASQGVSQSHLENKFGWNRGSDAAANYIHVFGEANDREIAKAYGMDVEETDPDPIGPVECPRCETMTPRERGFCLTCGQALDRELKELLDQVTRRLDEASINADSLEEREDYTRARRELQQKPGMIGPEELHSLASRLPSSSD
jgi:site-specific recombinase XerC